MRSLFPVALGAAIWLALCAFGGVIPYESVTPPAVAVAMGATRLAINADCYTGIDLAPTNQNTDPHQWYRGSWWDSPSNDAPTQYIFSDCPTAVIDFQWAKTYYLAQGCVTSPSEQSEICPTPEISTSSPTMVHTRGVGTGVMQIFYKTTQSLVTDSVFDTYFGQFRTATGVTCVADGYAANHGSIAPNTTPTSEIEGPEWSYGQDNLLHDGLAENTASSNCGLTNTGQTGTTSPSSDSTNLHEFDIEICPASDVGGDCTGTAQVCYYSDGTKDRCFDLAAASQSLHDMVSGLYEVCGGVVNTSSCNTTPPAQQDMEVTAIRYFLAPSCFAEWQAQSYC